ncbi:MAG: formate dehydrogenase subunit alpha [Planctomycetales bacterium]|nr:formate dehydrogenase subunit alpha [Planctomycetales bacterium]
MTTLTINDRPVEVSDGLTVLQAARANDITIPTLCDYRALSPSGNCRLCLVEIEGSHAPVASCTALAAGSMRIRTETPALIEMRRLVLEMLLHRYVETGDPTDATRPSELLKWCEHYGVSLPNPPPAPRFVPDSDPNPFVRVDLNKCILCTRCVRACDEIQGRFVWGVAYRGDETRLVAGADSTMLDARCESCGACVEVCPTGALDDRMSYGLGRPDKVVTTTCTYCGVGCQFDLNVKDNKIMRVTSNPESPVNGISLCVKGRYGYDFVHHPDRLSRPKVRRYLLEGNGERDKKSGRGKWVEVDWDTALDISAQKLCQARATCGPDSIGVLASAKCLNEDNYLMNKFARQVIGTNGTDHCARLCHSSTVAALGTAFGSGAMSNSMDDIAACAQAIFIIGSNTTEQHPVFGSKIRQAVLRRGAKLVVADPRKIDITEFATLHLRHRPGTDVALLNGLMHIMMANGWQDQAFIEKRTEGFELFQAAVMQYPPHQAAAITGVPVEQLHAAAEILATSKPMAAIWAMGITQHIVGVCNVLALANLQMLLGNIGVPGGGVNPLRGQNNVQGACDMGCLPDVYPGYQPVANKQVREKFEAAWGVSLPDKPGRAVTEMIPGILEGKTRALYILGEDPATSDPDSNHARRCLAECDFIVLQDIFSTETSNFADVLLPGVSFAEKTGTYTNTERRVQMCRRAIQPSGEAREDWRIIVELARRIMKLGERQPQGGTHSGWDYGSTADIMCEINALTPIYAGVTHERLERGEQLQWPVTGFDHPGTPILHTQEFTRGKGLFAPTHHVPPAELPDDAYPMLLNTGRVLYHWHGGALSRHAEGLMAIYSEPLIEVNPVDAERIGLIPDSHVRVTSRRGSIESKAWITDRVPPGMVYANFHFPAAGANDLTTGALDPIAKIPEYKICAVKIEAVADFSGLPSSPPSSPQPKIVP